MLSIAQYMSRPPLVHGEMRLSLDHVAAGITHICLVDANRRCKGMA